MLLSRGGAVPVFVVARCALASRDNHPKVARLALEARKVRFQSLAAPVVRDADANNWSAGQSLGVPIFGADRRWRCLKNGGAPCHEQVPCALAWMLFEMKVKARRV